MIPYIFPEGDTTDIILSGGYDTTSADFANPYIWLPGEDPIYLPIGIASTVDDGNDSVTVITTYNNTDATVTTPTDVSASYELAKLLNQSWNTSARSIYPLLKGSYLIFTTADISGACLMIGPKARDGYALHTFSHGLAVDISGVHVYENGTFKTTMRSPHSAVTTLRIYRHESGSIVYVTTTATETIVYNSLVPYPYPAFVDVFVYGYLYSSGDKITSASFEAGEVQYGSV